MKKLVVVNILFILLFSCSGVKTITLQNGRSKVPANPEVYANAAKFNNSLLAVVDTAAIYESFNQNYGVLDRLDTHVETSVYGVYRFYSNGRFNLFILNRNEPLLAKEFNPEFSGYRGIYYIENNQIHYDLFTIVDSVGTLDKLTGTFKFSGDVLYVERDKTSITPKQSEIYIKRKLPSGYLDYTASW